ncbi:MAG TPA: SagB/ThcOx family dehydrogenase [Anaerolineae bacterium]|nr:SagB/ThcOx family dehydrogenase [Anaerolineae bacterium]HPL29688.1 SagB/ThcOx family dehydrogenase [Anaerolineae bacterium]
MESHTGRPWFAAVCAGATVVGALLLSSAPARSRSAAEATQPQATPAIGPREPLPPPRTRGSLSLEEALERRRSIRTLGGEALSRQDIGQLLWATQGVTSPEGLRTAPSAGALYPLEVYVATAAGAYHYLPGGHALEQVVPGDLRPDLWRAALHQEPVRQAAAVFVVAGVYERTAAKYGVERAPRYVHLEAGHAAQNLLLEATTLGLGTVPIGAFDDLAVQLALGLPGEQRPLYLVPVGHPVA